MAAYDALHPLTKLTWAVVCITAAYLSAQLGVVAAAAAAAFVTVLWSAQRRRIGRILPLLFVPIIGSVVLFRVILFPDTSAEPLTISGVTLSLAAISNGAIIVLRYCTLCAALLTVFQTTPTAQLTHALAEKGLPRSIEFILLMALQIIPDMQQRAHAILEAQQSRGLVINSVVSRIRALVPLVGPLVVGALVDVEERGMALELRAFAATNQPTRLETLRDTPLQHWIRTGLLGSLVVMVLVTVLQQVVV